MKSFLRGIWLGHSLRAALIHFSVALWSTILVLDIFSGWGSGPNALAHLILFPSLWGLVIALRMLLIGRAIRLDNPPTSLAGRAGLVHMAATLTITCDPIWLSFTKVAILERESRCSEFYKHELAGESR